MRILVDENIPNTTVHELRAMGHDVRDIRGTERQGMFDEITEANAGGPRPLPMRARWAARVAQFCRSAARRLP